ncbi:hypothetical protein JCM24511_00826 [Saitozyma sp. JCM 24511]|nr:hypothetical protein JCM24511_00826 [Saitozyma sp. JCM 24511]
MVSPGSSSAVASQRRPPCDYCRAQKGRNRSDDPCKACERRKQQCTFDYVLKKPGRPRGTQRPRAGGTQRADEDTKTGSDVDDHRPSLAQGVRVPEDMVPALKMSAIGRSTARSTPGLEVGLDWTTVFGSADYALSGYDLGMSTSGVTGGTGDAPLAQPSDVSVAATDLSEQVFTSSADPSAITSAVAAAAPTAAPPLALAPPLPPLLPLPSSTPIQLGLTPSEAVQSSFPLPHVEDILPWVDANFFLSLHLRQQHFLTPFVHKPTFALDILHRRDKSDERFRAVLFSMSSICQCPINEMVGHYTRDFLEKLFHSCLRASRAIQLHHQLSPDLDLAISTELDWISSQSMGTAGRPLADVLMADTRRLMYSLKLHLAEPREGMSFIDKELSRRVFWCAYTTDKTTSLDGSILAFHDLEGLPPLPIEADDEYMSSGGLGSQPPNHTSFMVGVNVIHKIARIQSQATVYQRALLPGSGLVKAPHCQEVVAWLEEAFGELREIERGLPAALSLENGGTSGLEGTWKDSEGFAIQRANIITSLMGAQFQLLDLKAKVCPDGTTEAEREAIAKRAYETLSNIPIEHLAANGESMRGKVLRTILALLSSTADPSEMGSNVWDWWNMFLQLIPDVASAAVGVGAGL